MAAREGKTEIRVYNSTEELTSAAADLFAVQAESCIRENGVFTTALSGGSTPRALFQFLSKPPNQKGMDWKKVHFFWSDERCVPPSHADSNYRMARENLLDHVEVDEAKVHRMQAESTDKKQAALAYEEVLGHVLNATAGSSAPSMDLIFLGMGNDGHTASLFPHSEALNEKDRWVAPNFIASMNTWRMTFTAPIINKARTIVFLVKGGDKASRLKEVIEGPIKPMELPSQLIRPETGKLIWMLDAAAASELSNYPAQVR